VIVGDVNCGKTSILQRYIYDEFQEEKAVTVGVAYSKKHVQNLRGEQISLELWDTCGQERYRSLTHLYFRQTEGAIIVYDITRKDTFQNVSSWLESIREGSGKENLEIPIVVVGNKTDCENERQVKSDELRKFAETEKFFSCETSAKTGKNIFNIVGLFFLGILILHLGFFV